MAGQIRPRVARSGSLWGFHGQELHFLALERAGSHAGSCIVAFSRAMRPAPLLGGAKPRQRGTLVRPLFRDLQTAPTSDGRRPAGSGEGPANRPRETARA